jgi:hypothetical protein
MKRLVLAAALLAAPVCANAQQVMMDRGMRAGELWCFPLASDSTTYVYLPAAARLASDEQGRPQFSFVRYVINTNGDSSSASGITDARGGGVLHFLVMLETPPRMVDEASDALEKALKDQKVKLRGPIVFADGRYTLVSSVLREKEAAKSQVVATGRAPVLEGNRIALSFDLDPERATLLLQSFAMATPDVSLMFDMTFAGLSDAYDADLTVNWSEVRKSKSFSAGASYYFVGADIDVAFDELRRNNAIVLRTSGTNAASEALLTTVYQRLLGLMFKPVEPDRVPQENRGNLFDALGAMMSGKGPLSSRKMTGFGGSVGYQMRDLKTEGKSVMSFNHRATVERHALIAFNLGDFEREHGADPTYFRTVNLGDPAFQQREIQVGIDGALLPELNQAINSITVTMRKTHGNGQQTLRELVLDRTSAIDTPGKLRMVYGWNGDSDRIAWLGYDYRTRWSFKGGGVFETPWTRSDAPMIDLFAPYERRIVQLAGDSAVLRARGVRAVVVEVDYPFFGERRRPQMVVRPGDAIDEKRVEVTLPLGQPEYEVTMTWQLASSQRLTAKRRDSSGLVFVDDMPNAAAATP